MKLAPIILFCYNRPEHLKLTLEALSKNKLANESELTIFCDGPKANSGKDEHKKIEETRKVARLKQWTKKVSIIEKEENKGLANSIIKGITETLELNDRVIVLEDDLITSPYFLQYMNETLEIYKDVSNVYSVNGYMFPVEWERAETVLLPYTSTWGWGTWKDKWNAFEFEMDEKESIKNNPHLKARFNLADYPYSSMLDAGNNSWGIRWYYSVFKRNGLGVFPTRSLVENIGFDGSGSNAGQTIERTRIKIFSEEIKVEPIDAIELNFLSKYYSYFQKRKPLISFKYLSKKFK